MEQRFEVQGGGTLLLRQEGPNVFLDVRRNWDRGGLYKVWLHGGTGGKLLLGTLLPEGEQLHLTRKMTVGALERSGCWPVVGAKCVLSFPFGEQDGWYREEHPERWIKEPLLRTQLNGSMLCRPQKEGREFAVPFRTDAPVCLVSLICLAKPTQMNGRCYLVWNFDASGTPLLPSAE